MLADVLTELHWHVTASGATTLLGFIRHNLAGEAIGKRLREGQMPLYLR